MSCLRYGSLTICRQERYCRSSGMPFSFHGFSVEGTATCAPPCAKWAARLQARRGTVRVRGSSRRARSGTPRASPLPDPELHRAARSERDEFGGGAVALERELALVER